MLHAGLGYFFLLYLLQELCPPLSNLRHLPQTPPRFQANHILKGEPVLLTLLILLLLLIPVSIIISTLAKHAILVHHEGTATRNCYRVLQVGYSANRRRKQTSYCTADSTCSTAASLIVSFHSSGTTPVRCGCSTGTIHDKHRLNRGGSPAAADSDTDTT